MRGTWRTLGCGLANEHEFGEHQEGPEGVLNGGRCGFRTEKFGNGGEFCRGWIACEGVVEEVGDERFGRWPVLDAELDSAFMKGFGEGGSIGEIDGLERGQLVGTHGDDLIAVGTSEGAHEEVALQQAGPDHAGGTVGTLGEKGGALFMEHFGPRADRFDD